MNEEEIFGKIIQEERKAKKISQEKLSNLTGLDRTFISLIENGKRNPTLATILKISLALEVSPSELFQKFESQSPDFQHNRGR
jgi:transcriptional regulator with XRE-family HTH domain